ncbi:hypothetical protein FNU2_99 [Fusobacterium phage vB_FnuS_FNU2]|nr:hypothetical protein FNU2_99 [Fusobacterium phage vB_FnuS_FNU2]
MWDTLYNIRRWVYKVRSKNTYILPY